MVLEKMNNKNNLELQGIAASPGIIIGKAFLVNKEKLKIPEIKINSDEVANEISRFYKCLNEVIENITLLKNRIEKDNRKEEALILEMQLLLLNDSQISNNAVELIKEKKINSEWALNLILNDIIKKFESIDDPYLSERKDDIKHIIFKVINCLMGKKYSNVEDIKKPVILVAHDFSPAETIQMNFSKIKGFITEVGSKTSHTAIIARSHEIPAIVGISYATDIINGGDDIILDGFNGIVYVNPDKEIIAKYREKKQFYINFIESLMSKKDRNAVTKDGYQINIYGNIEDELEVESVLDHGGEGIGLFRTEYLYISNNELPTEEKHLQVYSSIAEKLYPKPFVIRTLDVGGDKFLENYNKEDQLNPAMGLRAIRFCLKEKEIFKSQLKGILRAKEKFDNIKMLVPMVSELKEIIEVKNLLNQCKKEVGIDKKIDFGIMIEIPSSAIIADIFARQVDFFSIGTNDLIQYTLAIDRLNQDVTYLYEPAHPAVLRLIENSINSAKKENIPVTMCGEMAGEVIYIPLLIAMGINSLSMNPTSIPFIKEIVCNLTVEECKKVFDIVKNFNTCSEIEGFLKNFIKEKFKDFSLIL
jgi:phosphotransferase system enzyme I (PtsI)